MMSCCALEEPEMAAHSHAESMLLLATDFDGTIAPIVARPEDAVIHDGARRLLERCAAIPSMTVAVLSGRDVDDVRARLGGVRAIVAGSHGLECSDADGRRLWSTPARLPAEDERLFAGLAAAGFLVERKQLAVALHFRERELGDAHPLLSEFIAWGRRGGLQIMAGRKVVEARVRGGGKSAALRRLASMTGARHVIYVGDDTTDVEALEYAAEYGGAIFVASSERATPSIEPLTVVQSVESACLAMIHRIVAVAPEAAVALHRTESA
jgi:trehalose-phosphatase